MTGLVLEGGAVRTIYSSGVCDGFLEQDFLADFVVGVSAGIAYGVSYVSRQEGRNLRIMERFIRDSRYMGAVNLLKPGNRSYFGLDFVYDEIPNYLVPFDYGSFETYPGRVEAGVTNLLTGKTDYYPMTCGEDKRFVLLRATCAMPLLFPTFEINGKPYLDGGVGDSVPFRRALRAGCDKLVVVLTRERSYYRGPEKLEGMICHRYREYPAFCEAIRTRAERYNADRAELLELERQGKALIFAPKCTKGFSRTERDLKKIRALWKEGRDEAVARIDEVRSFVGG